MLLQTVDGFIYLLTSDSSTGKINARFTVLLVVSYALFVRTRCLKPLPKFVIALTEVKTNLCLLPTRAVSSQREREFSDCLF